MARALLLALLTAAPFAAAACTGNTYTYGSAGCAPCSYLGATVVTGNVGGCAPSATQTAGPTDTAFYLSGSSVEGISAFPNVSAAAGFTYAVNQFGTSNGALAISRGSSLTVAGSLAPALLPAGSNVAFSASAWVSCPAPPASMTYAGVLEWGATNDVSAGAAPATAALAVSGTGLPPNSGNVKRWVGGGVAGGSGTADGTGSNALFLGPRAMAFIPSNGNIIVTDQSNHCLREVTPAGVVTKFAGLCGTAGPNDGTGTNARFNTLSGVAYHPAAGGFLLVADNSNHNIRMITYPGAVVTTFAGMTGQAGLVDAVGTNAKFNTPPGIAVIPSTGGIVVAGRNNNNVRHITYPGAVVSTLVGSPTGIGGYGDGVGQAASFTGPYGIAVSKNSDIIAATDSSGRIRLITYPGLVVTTVGGGVGTATDGVGGVAVFADPRGIAITAMGMVIAADSVRFFLHARAQ